jgi:hypothetical protein
MLKIVKISFVVLGFTLLSHGAGLADEAWKAPLHDGFDGSDFTPEGGLYYKMNDEQSAGKVEFQSEVKLSGKGALKLSVKSLCKKGDELCSERAEIWERTKLRAPYDQGIWFGFAVKFDDPYPKDDHRYLIAQWKREIGPDAKGDFSPFLGFRLDRGKLFVTIETNYQPGLNQPAAPGKCPEGSVPVWLRPDTNQMRMLMVADPIWTVEDDKGFADCTDKLKVTTHGNPLPEPSSGWIDFAVYSRPGPDGTGRIDIFANGKWIVTATGFIGHNDPGLGKNQYFKFGPYRAGASGNWTMYYDDFRRAVDCETVLRDKAACEAFAKDNGHQVTTTSNQ